MKVIILGAGASKSYEESLAKVKMPIASDFFSTFNKLNISSNPWVLIGAFLNYLKNNYNMSPEEFSKYNTDIENIHSEIQDKLIDGMSKFHSYFSDGNPEALNVYQSYMQLIFLFNSVINEIQNGPISKAHLKLAKFLSNEDVIITFNWDTLMDRALFTETNWSTQNGYYVKPKAIYKDSWIKNESKEDINAPLLLKLHGSTNWLTSYSRPEGGKMLLTQEASPDTFFVYESTNNPFDTFKGRYMSGYEPFSYGYYPPNIPDKGEKVAEGHVLISMNPNFTHLPKGTGGSNGLVSMPMIIPPVKNKSYNLFGNVFKSLWEKAEEALINADEIIILGYSFPKTDYQTNTLFLNAFSKRISIPEVTILNPDPDYLEYKFNLEYGIPKDKLRIYKQFFHKDYPIENIF